MSIPASFRRVIEAGDPTWQAGQDPECVIVYGGPNQRYLEVYTMEAVEEVEEKILAMPRGSQARKRLEKFFSGRSHTAAIDNTGRIVLPAKLRSKIGLEDEVFYLGTTDTFQIWNPADFDATEGDDEEWFEAQGEDFDILSLLDEGD